MQFFEDLIEASVTDETCPTSIMADYTWWWWSGGGGVAGSEIGNRDLAILNVTGPLGQVHQRARMTGNFHPPLKRTTDLGFESLTVWKR